MTQSLRRFALTAHVTSSVGWLGAVACFLALALVGLCGSDDQAARGGYVAMKLLTFLVILPLCFSSFLTGLVQSFVSPWGLFRHYWVFAKLVLTVLGTGVLLLHLGPIVRVAQAALEPAFSAGTLNPLRVQLAANAGAALLVLLVTTALSIYKPRGLTPYGQWLVAGAGRIPEPASSGSTRLARALLLIALVLALAFVVLHALGGGLGGH